MKEKINRFSFIYIPTILVICIITSLPLMSQETIGRQKGVYSELMQIHDRHFASNDLLINGTLYQPLHTKAEGDPYYPDPEFTDGKVFIAGRTFGPEKIKYNAELQQLILKRKISKDAISEILLYNSLVDSFYLSKKLFINAKHIASEDSLSGFLEVIYQDEFGFYASIKKIFKDDYTRNNPFGRYQQLAPVYIYVKGEESGLVKSRRDFLRLFGEDQKAIKKYMKQEGIKFKKASSKDISNIIRQSENIYRK